MANKLSKPTSTSIEPKDPEDTVSTREPLVVLTDCSNQECPMEKCPQHTTRTSSESNAKILKRREESTVCAGVGTEEREKAVKEFAEMICDDEGETLEGLDRHFD